MVCDPELVVVYFVGMQFPAGASGADMGRAVVPDCRRVSFFGALALWAEPIFLGLVRQLSGTYLLFSAMVRVE